MICFCFPGSQRGCYLWLFYWPFRKNLGLEILCFWTGPKPATPVDFVGTCRSSFAEWILPDLYQPPHGQSQLPWAWKHILHCQGDFDSFLQKSEVYLPNMYVCMHILYIYIYLLWIYMCTFTCVYIYIYSCVSRYVQKIMNWLPWLKNQIVNPLIMRQWPSGMPLLWRPLAKPRISFDHCGSM